MPIKGETESTDLLYCQERTLLCFPMLNKYSKIVSGGFWNSVEIHLINKQGTGLTPILFYGSGLIFLPQRAEVWCQFQTNLLALKGCIIYSIHHWLHIKSKKVIRP